MKAVLLLIATPRACTPGNQGDETASDLPSLGPARKGSDRVGEGRIAHGDAPLYLMTEICPSSPMRTKNKLLCRVASSTVVPLAEGWSGGFRSPGSPLP